MTAKKQAKPKSDIVPAKVRECQQDRWVESILIDQNPLAGLTTKVQEHFKITEAQAETIVDRNLERIGYEFARVGKQAREAVFAQHVFALVADATASGSFTDRVKALELLGKSWGVAAGNMARGQTITVPVYNGPVYPGANMVPKPSHTIDLNVPIKDSGFPDTTSDKYNVVEPYDPSDPNAGWDD